MYTKIQQHLSQQISEIREAGLYKEERIIESPQRAAISVRGKEVLNFCANNYLGLSDHPRLIEGAKRMMDQRGFGMSSVRFICGTQDIHKQLEAAISDYFKTDDTILYAACFDANGGVFEPLFTEEDAIISDALNHASIIDGVRLCKAKRYRYANADMDDLERCLKEAQVQRVALGRCGGGHRSWRERTLRHLRSGGHLYWYAGQVVWRCPWRIHHGSEGDYRDAQATKPSVSVLQLPRTLHHRCQPGGVCHA